MKPKIKRRKFTEKQMEMLEQFHYLHKKFWLFGLSEDEDEERDRIIEKVRKFIDF